MKRAATRTEPARLLATTHKPLRWVSSVATDIRRTFERARRLQRMQRTNTTPQGEQE